MYPHTWYSKTKTSPIRLYVVLAIREIVIVILILVDSLRSFVDEAEILRVTFHAQLEIHHHHAQ